MKTKIYNLSSLFIIVLVNLMMSSSIYAQAFEKISYQAVIRDANNNLITNQTIGMRVSILVGIGTAYIETHTPTTNANGLVSIEVGGGTLVAGGWSAIYWEYGNWYLPAIDELILMYNNKAIIDATAIANGGSAFDLEYHWSSNSGGPELANGIDFD